MDWTNFLAFLPPALFVAVLIVAYMPYVSPERSRLGRHYRTHTRLWLATRKAAEDLMVYSEPWPVDTCWRCKMSYQFQRLRWWLNGDVIV